MRPVQYFTKDYLAQCRTMKPDQVVRFLDGFRTLNAPARPTKSRLISMKVPQALLDSFKARSAAQGVPYQSQIKLLMQDWLARR